MDGAGAVLSCSRGVSAATGFASHCTLTEIKDRISWKSPWRWKTGSQSCHPTPTKSLGDVGVMRLFVCPVSMRAPASRGTVPATRSTTERHPIQVPEFRSTSTRSFFGGTRISFSVKRTFIRVPRIVIGVARISFRAKFSSIRVTFISFHVTRREEKVTRMSLRDTRILVRATEIHVRATEIHVRATRRRIRATRIEVRATVSSIPVAPFSIRDTGA
jgi:hypothetical protein